MFNWDDEDETRAGYRHGLEAVIGLTAQGKPVAESAVGARLDVSLDGIDDHRHIRKHAMAVAASLIRGPLRPSN